MTRVGRAGEFLFQVQEDSSGGVPCYGENDGGLILPLNNCEYHDYRPVIAATQFLSRGTRQFAHGPWDEDLLWLFGKDSLGARNESQTKILKADVGGYYTIRTSKAFSLSPAAPDFITGRRKPICCTSTSGGAAKILPSTPERLLQRPGAVGRERFRKPSITNTVAVDGLNQMEMAAADFCGCHGWRAALIAQNDQPPERFITGKANMMVTSAWRIRSGIGGRLFEWVTRTGSSSTALVLQRSRLSFTLAARRSASRLDSRKTASRCKQDRAPSLPVFATAGASTESTLIRADEKSPRGWASPYYGSREPALSLALTERGSDFEFFTFLGSQTPQLPGYRPEELRVETTEWEAKILLSTSEMLAKSISITGGIRDCFDLF